MSWPTPQEYNEAIQNPAACFADLELARGTTAVNALGLPRVASGNFASVYKIESAGTFWAVRCFLSNRGSQELRYQTISDFVLFDNLECTVDFYFLKQGIKVAGEWYPLLKMPWIDGELLDQFVLNNISRPQRILDLARKFFRMIRELEENDVAHGDLQHGNIIVTADGLRLVDYDALYVPGLAGFASLELGHPNYQHPERSEKHFDPTVDNFSTWLIYASLMCLAIDPSIYSQFESGDECLIFKRKDLTAPEESIVFQTLLSHESPEIRGLVKLVSRLLWLEPHTVPPLDLPDAENLTLNDVESVVDSASKPVEGRAQQQLSLTDSEEIDKEIRDTLTNTSNQGFQPVKTTTKRLSSVRALVKTTQKRMEILLDAAVHGLSPERWLRVNVNEADRLMQIGEFEKALELYKGVQSRLDSMVDSVAQNRGIRGTIYKLKLVDEQMNLVLKRGRCHILMNQLEMARNFFILGARSIETPATGHRSSDLIDKKRDFFASLTARAAENNKQAVSALNDLLIFHRSIYYGPEEGKFYSYERINDFADDLADILDFLKVARDVVSRFGAKPTEWRKHLALVLEFAWLWHNGDYDLPKSSPRTRQCIDRICDYADEIVAAELAEDVRQALVLAMIRCIANRSVASQQLMNCLLMCTESQAEQAFTELSQHVHWQEILELLARALARIGPSPTMTSLGPLIWSLYQTPDKKGKWNEKMFENKLVWLSTLDERVICACLTEDIQEKLVSHGHALFLKRYLFLSFAEFVKKCAGLGEPGDMLVGRILSKMIDSMLVDKDKYSLDDVVEARQIAASYNVSLDRWEEFNDWFLSLR